MAAQESFGLKSIGQIAINVHDLDRATEFYRDKLGMKYLFSVPPQMAFFDCDGIMFMLALADRPDQSSSIVYFNVSDIDEATRILKERGVEFREDPNFVADMGTYELWLAFLSDSENNVIGLRAQKVKRSG